MKYLSLIVIVGLALTSSSEAAPLYSNNAGGAKAVTDSYIVMLKDGSSINSFQPKFNKMLSLNVNAGVRSKTKINHHFSNIPGFLADLDSASLKNILSMPEVDYVEQDVLLSVLDQAAPPSTSTQANPPSWGLSRVSQRKALGNTTPPYLYPKSAGAGVTVYVIDSGIMFNHTDFEGRATHGKSFVNSAHDHDENGHGTHVAGTIGGKKYGVAKKVNLVSVKVADIDGYSTLGKMAAGLDWVITAAKGKRAVVSMSMSTSASEGKKNSLDGAVEKLFKAGIPVFVSAGNEGNGHSACQRSPARSESAFTVAATDKMDNVAGVSSLGKCVNIFAPGEDIKSDAFKWDQKTNSMTFVSGLRTGTSMAVPHVSGIAALYMGEDKNLKTPTQIYNKVKSTASKGVIKKDENGTGVRDAPNLLVFNGVGK